MEIKTEDLAYWYLRLNGFLTITNFVVHRDDGAGQETDVDVLGVRFPHRAENLRQPMRDDEWVMRYESMPLIAITEVKEGRCGLNGPWRNPERRNILRVVRAVGAFPEAESDAAAAALNASGSYTGERYHASLVCIGNERSPDVERRYPNVPQILWPTVLGFIYRRFHEYRAQKEAHQQWDEAGHALWNHFYGSRGEAEFVSTVRAIA